VTKACRGGRGGWVFKEMKLFLKGHGSFSTRRHHLERFISLYPRCTLRLLRPEPCYCLALTLVLSIARCLHCHVASRSHQQPVCHLPWPRRRPPRVGSAQIVLDDLRVHVAQIRELVIFAYSWDTDLHIRKLALSNSRASRC